jgi:hypothetical protein
MIMTFGRRHIGTGKGLLGGFCYAIAFSCLIWALFFALWFALGMPK